MPDSAQPTTPPASPAAAGVDHADALHQTAAEAVLAVPGVTKLEPTLRNALHRLHTTASWLTTDRSSTTAGGTTHTAGEGISITRRGAVIDIHVDIAITPIRPAHLTAHDVKNALTSHLTEYQLTPGIITVAVLTIEH